MDNIKILPIIALLLAPSFTKENTAEEVIKLMYKKYGGKWARTLMFDQTTDIYRDTVKTTKVWHESMIRPNRLRIDIEPSFKNLGVKKAQGSFRYPALT